MAGEEEREMIKDNNRGCTILLLLTQLMILFNAVQLIAISVNVNRVVSERECAK